MKKISTVVFANGCFWCTEAVFQQIKGVEEVFPVYTGGVVENPTYEAVCSGNTAHAEGVLLNYNASLVSFTTLLEVFFATHDPTTLNRQGNDVGTQYRSEIFYTTLAQKEQAQLFIEQLEKAEVFENKIVTQLTQLTVYYKASLDHINYYNNNKQQSYCKFVITPKLEKIKMFYAEKLKTK